MSQERRTMLKRRRILSMAGTAALIGLAGCGGDGGDSDTTTTTSTTADPTTTSTTAEPTTTTTESTTDTTTTEDPGTTTESTTTTTTDTPTGGIPPGTELVFDGRVSGWLGTSPSSIADENNPALQLHEGAEYTFTWNNVDGAPHNVIIEDESGNTEYVATEIITSGSQSTTFTVEPGMASYYCEVHPSSMRAPIEVL